MLFHQTEKHMSLKVHYMGQNDSVNCTPAVPLTGTVSGYAPGSGYSIQPTNQPAFGAIGNIVPCDRASANTAGNIPFATLLNNGGEFAGAIGPSGSKKAPVVRAMWQGMVGNSDGACYDANGAVFTLGGYLYCGGSGHTNTGQYTDVT